MSVLLCATVGSHSTCEPGAHYLDCVGPKIQLGECVRSLPCLYIVMVSIVISLYYCTGWHGLT